MQTQTKPNARAAGFSKEDRRLIAGALNQRVEILIEYLNASKDADESATINATIDRLEELARIIC